MTLFDYNDINELYLDGYFYDMRVKKEYYDDYNVHNIIMDIDFDKFGLDILINTAAIIKRNLREEKIDKLLL